jgi:hypothetical protein
MDGVVAAPAAAMHTSPAHATGTFAERTAALETLEYQLIMSDP